MRTNPNLTMTAPATNPELVTDDDTRRRTGGRATTLAIEMPLRPGQQSRRLEASLLGISGRTKGRRVAVRGALEIGSDEHCELFVDDIGVSRHHARISFTGEQATIEDLESTNGTFVNGERVVTPRRLEHEDQVQLGVAAFRFQLVDDAAAAVYDELYALATKDPLTGLLNRHHLRSEAERDLDRAVRAGGHLCVLMVDVDHFKRFNDTWGHAAGDAALVVVAQRLLACVRTSDSVGRWGGEEFVVTLPDTPLADAVIVAERIRARMVADPVRLEAGETSVTVSIGAADLVEIEHEQPTHGASREQIAALFDAIVARADARLYAAKRGGRDRVCATDDPS